MLQQIRPQAGAEGLKKLTQQPPQPLKASDPPQLPQQAAPAFQGCARGGSVLRLGLAAVAAPRTTNNGHWKPTIRAGRVWHVQHKPYRRATASVTRPNPPTNQPTNQSTGQPNTKYQVTKQTNQANQPSKPTNQPNLTNRPATNQQNTIKQKNTFKTVPILSGRQLMVADPLLTWTSAVVAATVDILSDGSTTPQPPNRVFVVRRQLPVDRQQSPQHTRSPHTQGPHTPVWPL